MTQNSLSENKFSGTITNRVFQVYNCWLWTIIMIVMIRGPQMQKQWYFLTRTNSLISLVMDKFVSCTNDMAFTPAFTASQSRFCRFRLVCTNAPVKSFWYQPLCWSYWFYFNFMISTLINGSFWFQTDHGGVDIRKFPVILVWGFRIRHLYSLVISWCRQPTSGELTYRNTFSLVSPVWSSGNEQSDKNCWQ